MPVPDKSGSSTPKGAARAPDFFIVGHPKSGTTALYQMLRQHPQIYMPELKEPQFFATDLRPRREPDDSWPPRFPSTYEEYLSLYEPAGVDQLLGDATATYLRSAVAASAIAAVQPAARIIAIFRDPAELVRSLHLQWLQIHIETEPDLRKAVSLEENRRKGKLAPGEPPQARILLYSDFVHYVDQLRRYEALFPPAQILVLIYEDFRRDNEQTVRRLLDFLGVDATVAIEPVEANPTVAVRSPALERLVRRTGAGSGPISGPARAIVTAVTPEQARRKVFYPLRRRLIYRRPKPVDEAFMMELRRRFKPEVEALSEHLDRDLVALWGYQSLH